MSERSQNENPTRLLNVDLELVGTAELDPLLQRFSVSACVLRDSNESGRRTVWLELEGESFDANGTLVRFAELVAGLPRDMRALWDRCDDRCLNVGIQAGTTPHDAAFRIEAGTVARLAGIAARLEFTVYATEPEPGATAAT
jgi:hypothetical protein